MSFLRAIITVALPCLLAAQSEVSPVFGGRTPGSGVALGVEYQKSGVVVRPLDFSAKAVGSVEKYELMEAGFKLSQLAGGRLFAEAGARYRNFPEEDFWGLGPDTPRGRRATFRLEDLDVSGVFGVRLLKGIEAGATAGRTYVNTGTGRDSDWPSIEQVFTAGEVPALVRQPGYDHWN